MNEKITQVLWEQKTYTVTRGNKRHLIITEFIPTFVDAQGIINVSIKPPDGFPTENVYHGTFPFIDPKNGQPGESTFKIRSAKTLKEAIDLFFKYANIALKEINANLMLNAQYRGGLLLIDDKSYPNGGFDFTKDKINPHDNTPMAKN